MRSAPLFPTVSQRASLPRAAKTAPQRSASVPLEPPAAAINPVIVDEVMPDQRTAFSEVHNSRVGHHGVHRTVRALIRRGFRWPRMHRDVATMIAACAFCQKERLAGEPPVVVLSSLVSYSLFEELAIDFIGPLPADAVGNIYIFNAICVFSRFTELIAAHRLLQIFARYGCFKRLRSDRGSHFVNGVSAAV